MFANQFILNLGKSSSFSLNSSRSHHYLRSNLLIPNFNQNIASKTNKKQAEANYPLAEHHKENDSQCKSHAIIENNGFLTDSSAAGFLTSLPLGKRVLNKLIDLIRYEMNKIQGQEIEMPSLCDLNLWKKTGRAQLMDNEMFTLTDRRDKQLCLCPTHEELVTILVSKFTKIIPSSCLDEKNSLKLYQITRKYRDESRPKHGLMRTREFLMKDMYSFHLSEESVEQTYNEVCKAYEKIFERLNLNYRKAAASVGTMGGKRSHEYHVSSPIGEDKIFTCPACKKSLSIDLIEKKAENEDEEDASTFIEQRDMGKIIGCECATKNNARGMLIEQMKCIEIGHTFILGDRYTKIFPIELETKLKKPSGNKSQVIMGCYGIGVSRLLQACIETLNVDDHYPNFPFEIAPFKLGIIPARAGSKEDKKSQELVKYLCNMLDVKENPYFYDDILVDDRTNMTIGSRIIDAKLAGIPILLVLGKSIHEEQIEIMIISQTMKDYLKKDKLECHSRETAHVLKQLINDYFYVKKQKKFENHFQFK
jgi:prolyl-tRNA synthetase